MEKYNFLQPYLGSKIQDQFLIPMMSFSAKSMILVSVSLTFSLLQVADAINSEKVIHSEDSRIT